MKTILETLAEKGSFHSLLAALEQANLTEKLAGPGPFTLFAPDDRAFERVNFQEIGKDKETLSSVLTYHLLSGRSTFADIGAKESLYTQCNKSLTVHLEEGKPVIDNGNVINTDIECTNGIIHVIDNVFLPQFSGWYCGCC